jgi:hypothetical protein
LLSFRAAEYKYQTLDYAGCQANRALYSNTYAPNIAGALSSCWLSGKRNPSNINQPNIGGVFSRASCRPTEPEQHNQATFGEAFN